MTPNPMNDRVCAVVVTYNRKALLRDCLKALQSQTRPVTQILVVDNKSSDGTLDMLAHEYPEVAILALKANIGGAGGFHEGMKRASDEGNERQCDWLWLMDDDGCPAPDCLEKLLAARRAPSDEREVASDAVMVPMQRDSGGHCYGFSIWRGWDVDVTPEIVAGRSVSGERVFRFVGPLIPVKIVREIGLPHKDFFIWFDDIEYAWRVQRQTKAEIIFVPEAVFAHDFGGQEREVSFLGRRSKRGNQPAWKLYYGARNHLYVLLRGGRDKREVLIYLKQQLRGAMGEILYEADRWKRVRMRLMGMRDGVLGRLGKRVKPA